MRHRRMCPKMTAVEKASTNRHLEEDQAIIRLQTQGNVFTRTALTKSVVLPSKLRYIWDN